MTGDAMLLKRIPDKLKSDIEQFRSSHTNEILFFSSDNGMGKTFAALSYCAEDKDSLYFSFRHIGAEFAPKIFSNRYPEIFKDCSDWTAFFADLRQRKTPNRLF